MTPERQALVFAAMAACGACMGAVYDVFSAAGALCPIGCGAGQLLDLLFGPLCAAAVIGLALTLHVPVLRFYVFAAAALGFLVYIRTLGMFFRYLAANVRQSAEKS